jgi:hypothetical protein
METSSSSSALRRINEPCWKQTCQNHVAFRLAPEADRQSVGSAVTAVRVSDQERCQAVPAATALVVPV